MPPVVVLPPRALEYLSEHGAGDLSAAPQLGEKRAARYGDALRRACELWHPALRARSVTASRLLMIYSRVVRRDLPALHAPRALYLRGQTAS